ncbi:MAG: hypothetical protein M1840_007489 [Geoglossum simile]|nr:MAG: hypothetical protein M1840_007489 [Geoglossum simile]
MGNLCGKESSDSFAGPGRQLGSSSPPVSGGRAALPNPKPKITGPGRTLSEGARPTGASGGTGDDARRQAAQAAEERAQKAKQVKGKLGTQLAQQRQQTRTDTLGSMSAEEMRRRDQDENAAARDWN